MSKRTGFEVVWSAEDGYVGKGRPQSFYIEPSDIEGYETDEELEKLLDDMARDDFENRVSYSVHNSEDFIAWAREIINAGNGDDK